MSAKPQSPSCFPESRYHRSSCMTIISIRFAFGNCLRISGTSLHPDCLYIRKFTNSVSAQLPAVTRELHTAEWEPRVGEHHLIDKHHSCLKFVDESFLLTLIIRPRARAQAEPAIVGDTNRFVGIFHAENGGYRAKKLFAVGRRIVRNVRQNRGGIKI